MLPPLLDDDLRRLQAVKDFAVPATHRVICSDIPASRQASGADLPRAIDTSIWRCAAASGLHRWAWHRPVRAKHAAIARPWFKPFATSLAVIEKMTSIRLHSLSRLVSALWTSDCGSFDHNPGLMLHFRQGAMLYELIPMMPEPRLRPMVERFGAMLLEIPAFAGRLWTI